jgi:hypothetical protein
MSLHLPGTCLHPADENHRVVEQIAALERVPKDATSLWADPRRRSAVVLLQDRAQHIGEAVDGFQRSLTTMYSVMLPRNPPPGSFKQLLNVFRSSQQIHWLVELNLVAGANFALGWILKEHLRAKCIFGCLLSILRYLTVCLSLIFIVGGNLKSI